jgi:MYXO-CTERM domain-containing protein
MLAAALASLLAIAPALAVPWRCGEAYACTQANGEQPSHTGLAQYAWDFGMPLGTDVLAARGGTVLAVEMDSRVGGCSDVYAHDANYVLIDHHDGSAGLYLHLEGDSSSLQLGDRVATGDMIARVGQTGWTCGPHLHFQVQEICGSWWCQSLPATFDGVGAIAPIEREDCGAPDGAGDNRAGPRDLAGTAEAGRVSSPSSDPGVGLLALLGLGFLARRRQR